MLLWGVVGRHRRRPDRAGARRDRRDALVHRTARPRARRADRRVRRRGNWSSCRSPPGWRAATGGASALAPTLIGLGRRRASRSLLFMVDRPADVGLAPYGETGRCAARAAPRRGLGGFRVLGEISGSGAFWVLAGDLLHLRPEHQRPDPDAFHFALRGFRRRRRSPPPRRWR